MIIYINNSRKASVCLCVCLCVYPLSPPKLLGRFNSFHTSWYIFYQGVTWLIFYTITSIGFCEINKFLSFFTSKSKWLMLVAVSEVGELAWFHFKIRIQHSFCADYFTDSAQVWKHMLALVQTEVFFFFFKPRFLHFIYQICELRVPTNTCM